MDSGSIVLEVGPGTGRLAADVLDGLESQACQPASYQLLEVSADLRQRQREALEKHIQSGKVKIEWLDQPPVASWNGVLIANEVLDALPVRCFEITSGSGFERVLERVVVMRDGSFGWDRIPADEMLRDAVASLEHTLDAPFPAGYRSELCLEMEPWLGEVLANFESGLILFSDYGLPRAAYYLPERNAGTLICHYRQRAHDDPFRYPGLQDISAWVDFTAVAEAGERLGLALAGFTTQAHFLIGAGLEQLMQGFTAKSPEAQLKLASEIKTLTLPGEMGERFKFIALTKNSALRPCGFSFKDMRDKL